MFEIFGKIGTSTELEDPYHDNKFYYDKTYVKHNEKTKRLDIYALSHKEDSTIYESNDYIVIILGHIYTKFDHSIKTNCLSAKEIHDEYLKYENFYEQIKGNFSLLIYSKFANELRIINDHFALKPVYYGFVNDDFYFTNNLNNFRIFNLELNNVAVLEKLLFSYPLFDSSYFEGISVLGCGEEIITDGIKVKKKTIFDLNKFIFNGIQKKFSIDEFVELINKSVLQKVNSNENVLSSLTGGFDGRLIVSSLLKNNINFRTYSFGKKGGENTEVPIYVSKKIGINHEAFYLEEDYEKVFDRFALEAIYFSDGMSYISRANYNYVFSKLQTYSTTILTGLIAGEILRPLHLKADYMNQLYYKLFYEGKDFNIIQYWEQNQIREFVEYDFIKKYQVQFNERFKLKRKEIISKKDKEDGYLYYLYDLIKNGFRKYYGTEMHMERAYADNITPVYDFDVIKYLIETDYKHIYKNSFSNKPLSRQKGQKIYSKIFQKNYPTLGEMPVDRGYPPSFLIHPLKKLIIPFLYCKRYFKRKISTDEFAAGKWAQIFYRKIDVNKFSNSSIFNVKSIKDVIINDNQKQYTEFFNQLYSLYTWLEIDDFLN